MNEIQKKLFSMQDLEYRNFHSKLMPTTRKEEIIGVRVPELKKYAKELYKNGNYAEFLEALPHKYYEENNLHAFIIMNMADFESALMETEKFLPYIDNWATCDGLRPKVFRKNLPKLFDRIKLWIKSGDAYTVRFAIGMLMCHFLEENYKNEYSDMVAEIKSEEYYVKMMQAWYFATALTKQQANALSYIENKKLGTWVHNKTIQKACESYRVTDEEKKYLKSLKIYS